VFHVKQGKGEGLAKGELSEQAVVVSLSSGEGSSRLSRPLLVSGFMATGKSTVGPLVAALAGVPFLDLDAAIEAAAGRTVAEVFAESGEAAFRALEAEVLSQELARSEPRVIALGGGALVHATLRAQALEKARVVTLIAQPETIASRAGPGRPLLDAAENRLTRIRELLGARATAYAESHALIRTDERSPAEIAEAVLAAWRDATEVVPLGPRSYSVRLTEEAPAVVAEVVRSLAPSAAFLVTDENVAPLYLSPLQEAVEATGLRVRATVVLAPGEANKQLGAVERVLSTLVQAGADREAVIIALGGGVVSDIAGFAAAT